MHGRPCPVLLMLRRLNYGGTERQLTEIAKALDRSRFEPHVGCFFADGLVSGEVQAAGVPIAEFPVRSFASPSVLRAARMMGGYLRRHGIRLVHTFDVPANLFGVFVARAYGVPVVISSQRAHRELTPGKYQHLLRITDRLVDAVVVNCQAMYRHLAQDERVPAARLRLCYNSIDTCTFYPRPKWRPPELAGASLVIGTACRFNPEKGVETLVEAFSRVRGLQPGLKLLLMGDGICQADLAALARRRGIEEDCVFLPPSERIQEWLGVFDVFVLPSLSEALSNSIMEAMASGCCVVASSAGGNPELVLDGETGLLFEPGDAGGLARNLELLIREPCARERLATDGMRFITGNFSLKTTVDRMEAIYSELLAEYRL